MSFLGITASNEQRKPLVITNGLSLYLDAINPASYPGTGSTWYDLSGNGNNGTLVNSPTYTTITSVKTFAFDGVTNRVSFSYQTPVQSNSTGFTWGAWIRANRNFDGDVLMGYRGTTPLEFYKMTTQKFEMYPAEVFSLVTLTTWVYLCAVWDGSGSSGGTNMKWYHNAVNTGLRDADNPTFKSTAMPFYIGGDPTAGEYFQGYISAAHVYSRALTSTEITNNFDAMKSRYGY